MDYRSPPKMVNINTVPAESMVRHPYKHILQGSVTNLLSRTNIDMENIDNKGNVLLVNQGLSIFIEQFNSLPVNNIRHSCHRLFDILLIKYTEYLKPLITISLDEYMRICKLKDKPSARKQVVEDLEVLFRCRLSFIGKTKKDLDFNDLRLCSSKGIKNGIISLNLTEEFRSILRHCYKMPFPIFVLQASYKKHPNSYYLARRIFEHKRINLNNKDKDIISVKTLLKSCPNLRNYDKEKYKSRIIIDPFERDMDYLSEQIQWHYCLKGENDLTKEQLDSFKFSTFIECNVKFTIINYQWKT